MDEAGNFLGRHLLALVKSQSDLLNQIFDLLFPKGIFIYHFLDNFLNHLLYFISPLHFQIDLDDNLKIFFSKHSKHFFGNPFPKFWFVYLNYQNLFEQIAKLISAFTNQIMYISAKAMVFHSQITLKNQNLFHMTFPLD